MKRLLYIADTVPFPFNTGGKLRTANILIQLSTYYDVDFVVYSTDPVNDSQKEEAEKYCKNLYCFAEGIPAAIKRVRNLLSVKCNKEFVVYSKNMQETVDTLLIRNKYDLIFIERLYGFQYVEKYLKNTTNSTPTYVDMHDVESDTIQYFKKMTSSMIKKLYYNVEYMKVKRLEKKAIAAATGLITVSERDMEVYKKRYPAYSNKLQYMNNGIDMSKPQNEPVVKRDIATIMFIGSLRHPPNSQALEWFISNVWECILKNEPQAKFQIIGSGELEASLIQKIKSKKNNIDFLGYVENIYPLLRKCTCLVVPLLSGSGTRLKILEAFSFSIPIVSTTIGAEGLPIKHEKNIMIADTERDFATETINLLRDSNLANRIASNGYHIVKIEYNWENIVSKFVNQL